MVVAVSREGNRVMVTVTRGRNILHSEVHHEEMSSFLEMIVNCVLHILLAGRSLANENDTEIYTDILLILLCFPTFLSPILELNVGHPPPLLFKSPHLQQPHQQLQKHSTQYI